jgi:hypothetical protein
MRINPIRAFHRTKPCRKKQKLFINSIPAQPGGKMFRQGMIEYQGLYMNPDVMKVNPIPV